MFFFLPADILGTQVVEATRVSKASRDEPRGFAPVGDLSFCRTSITNRKFSVFSPISNCHEVRGTRNRCLLETLKWVTTENFIRGLIVLKTIEINKHALHTTCGYFSLQWCSLSCNGLSNLENSIWFIFNVISLMLNL